jgi:ACS family pantothenate transporter-like MFS transporter
MVVHHGWVTIHHPLDGQYNLSFIQHSLSLLPDGVIALPICFAGYFFLPDTPDRPNPRARWLRPEDVLTGRARMARIHRVEQKGFSVGAFVQAFASWIPWCFAPMYVCYVLGLSSFACEFCRVKW